MRPGLCHRLLCSVQFFCWCHEAVPSLAAGTELLRCDGHDLAVTLSSDPGALVRRNRSPYWVAVTESQKSQWRSAEYCASVKVDSPGRSWISQTGVSALAV